MFMKKYLKKSQYIYIPGVKSTSTSSSSSSEPAMPLSIRITVLFLFSLTYLLLAVIIAPTAIRKCWSNFKSWLLGIDAENLGYNALFQRPALDKPQQE
jgi:hypothetical protein